MSQLQLLGKSMQFQFAAVALQAAPIKDIPMRDVELIAQVPNPHERMELISFIDERFEAIGVHIPDCVDSYLQKLARESVA